MRVASTSSRLTLVAVTGFASLGIVSCEDGPTQTFSPAPPGADWNDGRHGGVADPNVKNPFGQDFGGATSVDTCVGQVKRDKLAKAFNADILPPIGAAGLDLRGKGGEADYSFLKIDDVLSADGLCQGQTETGGSDFGYGRTFWGDAQEIGIRWNVASRRMERIWLFPGYTGKLVFDGPDVGDPNNYDKATWKKYRFGVNTLPQRSSDKGATWQDFPLEFVSAGGRWKLKNDYLQAFANGMIETFDPTQKKVGQDGKPVDCAAAGRCLTSPGSVGTTWGVRPVGMYFGFDNVTLAPSIASKPSIAFITPVKFMAFSSNPMFLKLQDGPEASQAVGDLSPLRQCNIRMLMTHKEFTDNCINVFKNPNANALGLRKWFGGVGYDDEHYFPLVQAVDLQVTATLPWNDVIHDGTKPGDNDIITGYQIDVRASGDIANDFTNYMAPGNTKKYGQDWHGSSAVYWEYARSVQEDLTNRIQAYRKSDPPPRFKLGAPECLYPTTGTVDPLTWRPADGCTGFEGFITIARPNLTGPDAANYNKLRSFDNRGYFPGLKAGFKPGDPQAVFCFDPVGFSDGCDYTGTLWDTSFRQVRKVAGKGDLYNLPPEVRDRRYFFRQWGLALVKYMRVAHLYGPDFDPRTTPIDLSNVDVDPDSLFFDNVGDGTSEKVEYVERSQVSPTSPPVDFEYEADLLGGNQRYLHFYKRLDRPERALYVAMSPEADKSAPGSAKQKLLMSDVFGSPVLRGIPAAQRKACIGGPPPIGSGKPADLSQCPEDGFGNKIDLRPYRGAFTGTPFTITPFADAPRRASFLKGLKLLKRRPDIRQAEMEIPNFVNPYDSKSTALDPLKVLVVWAPKQPGVGYPVAINGVRDDFVQTALLDFRGITETFSLLVDYIKVDVPATGAPVVSADVEGDAKNILVKAVVSSDFLGDIFLCQDPSTGHILRGRMYDSVSTIIEWLDRHPTARGACGIIIRYSPYNNWPDFVISTTNGVRAGVNQGGGFGRLVDAMLYTPS